jgi:Domain of unknown function (DUF4091)
MQGVVRLVLFVVVVLALSAGSGAAHSTRSPAVAVYASGTTFDASAPTRARAAATVSLAMPIGGVDDATINVRGAQKVAIRTPAIASPLQLKLFFAHYVSVKGRAVPDALLPWDGSQRSTEHTNQPLWLQVTVPYGTAPGAYGGSLSVVADGTATNVPISVTVSSVTLPQADQVAGSLLTAFNMSPQSYGNKVHQLYGVLPEDSLPGLFSFFASYRLSPNNWGYGNPKYSSGYTSDRRWWLDKSARMVEAVGEPGRFASMWIPLSNNRSTSGSYVGGISPYKPKTWCRYLRSVRGFWQKHSWLGSYPYLYAMDEPGPARFKVVRGQAKVTHACFPGSHVLVTGRPSQKNRPLWNGGSDDVDVWAVLESRYYGEYTTPGQASRHDFRAEENLRYINAARNRGKQIWTYTYASKAHTTPGFTLTEPVADPRMFVDWAALEGITGILRGQGMTSYSLQTNPLVSNDKSDGDYVLIYPGRDAPIPSARLEVLREGIEDWEILNVVRHKHGNAAVRRLLSTLFSTTAKRAKLGCFEGCELRTPTNYSWPTFSRDASTGQKLMQMRVAALQAASH